MTNVLFIVENDYFPRDARVYNECMSLEKNSYNCFVIAPKQKDEKMFEKVEDKVPCYRFPHFEASSLVGLPIEYLNALIWIFLYSFYIIVTKKIKVIHLANPPDFIVPLLLPLKIFSLKLIFDVHDLSVETYCAKGQKKGIASFLIKTILSLFEKISVRFSDVVIFSNYSICEYLFENYGEKIDSIKYVVRNSNRIHFKSIEETDKRKNKNFVLGYFGVINDDISSGYDSIVYLAELLNKKGIPFLFEIIGDGSGLEPLKSLVNLRKLEANFNFHGYLSLNESFIIIKNFDFGIVPLPNNKKNNIHTAMKIMDYMCCGVPVCSLNLKEQIISTNGIGIHTNSFEEMIDEMIDVYNDKNKYETLRRNTLEYFNTSLCWEKQETELLKCYRELQQF